MALRTFALAVLTTLLIAACDVGGGAELALGDRFRPRPGGSAAIIFFGGSVVFVAESADVTIEQLLGSRESGRSNLQLFQTAGRTLHRVNKLVDTESSYTLRTSTSIGVVRGTLFIVNDSPGGTNWKSIEGDIGVAGESGDETIVSDGTSSNVPPDGDPSPPMIDPATPEEQQQLDELDTIVEEMAPPPPPQKDPEISTPVSGPTSTLPPKDEPPPPPPEATAIPTPTDTPASQAPLLAPEPQGSPEPGAAAVADTRVPPPPTDTPTPELDGTGGGEGIATSTPTPPPVAEAPTPTPTTPATPTPTLTPFPTLTPTLIPLPNFTPTPAPTGTPIPAPPVPSIDSPAGGATVTAGTIINVSGSGTAGPGLSIGGYSWGYNGAQVSGEASFTLLINASGTLTLKVRDSSGVWSEQTASVSISVIAPTPTPTTTSVPTATPEPEPSSTPAPTPTFTPTQTPTTVPSPTPVPTTSLSTVDSAGTVGLFTSLELDSSGFPVISYFDSTGNRLKIAHCIDADCASTPNLNVADPTTVAGPWSSLELDASGFPVISHHCLTATDLQVVHCTDANCASAPTVVTAEVSAGDVGSYTSVALDSAGFPVISYYDATAGDLKVLHCGDANCTTGTPVSLDTINDTGKWTSIALDASGFPVVSYYDATIGRLRVMHCLTANCVSTPIFATPDAASLVGQYTSLVLDASGFPVVSYWDQASGALKVLHCGDANCTGGANVITSPDTAGSTGLWTSITLDGSGFPVVSYSDATNGDLKVLHCSDVNCATGNTIATVDSAGSVGVYSSIALDSSGFPVISYWDLTNGDLKLAQCVNATCVPAGA